METRILSHDYHPRSLDENRYVYAVLSRRSGGVSIGINLNPDKVCNFDCVYCQVDRRVPGNDRRVDLEILKRELTDILFKAKSGALFQQAPFSGIEKPLQNVTDIAFSGDGEPTTCPEFGKAVELAIAAKKDAGLPDLKLLLITNAAMFHRAKVKRVLSRLDENQGEIWAKLDAGTEQYYHRVDVTTIPFARILNNLLEAARQRPIVIQSLFMRLYGSPPDDAEIDAYCNRLRDIVSGGGQIKLVQIHTVARTPAQPYVTALSDKEVDAIAAQVRQIPLPAATYYSRG
jgi:wyosine [tRNA(Phe)-imidazoG37] synthetase (radical SAM superfamily)